MNIIIAGAGHVGYELAKTLSPYHNVTVIDKDELSLNSLQENMDILPIFGDVEDPSTYQKLLDKEFDLFIAVTSSDEANLISVIIASDSIDIKTTIIRLENHFFAKSSLMEKFGIDEAIFPLELTTKNVVNLLKYPKANNVKSFKYTDKKLISLKVTNIEGPTHIVPKGYVVVGIERDGNFFIPMQDEPIYPNDLIYLFGDEISIIHFCKTFVKEDIKEPQRVVIFGAGDLGISIANALVEEEKEVKLIDKDLKRCKLANEKLAGRAMVLNSKFGTDHLYEHEGLELADVVIATTNNDEYNIVKCLEAKNRGLKKVIAINNDLEHYALMHKLNIVAVRGPKISAYNSVLEKIRSSQIVTEKNYCGGRGRVYMHRILEGSNMVGQTVHILQSKTNLSIYLIRDNEITPCSEDIVCQTDDIIVAFCTSEYEDTVEKWMHSF